MSSIPTLADSLIEWYAHAKRDLPWRRTVDPYAIWVSEAMLQQTQVATALPYYERWMKRFPDVDALARASEGEALAVWQGLGYYSRCKSLLKGAKCVSESGWPATYADWLKMPGVGEYTAAAIASICLGEATAVVDGNVERVYARVMGSGATGGNRRREAQRWASGHIPPKEPATFNQALMELGATVCRPRQARCQACPISSHCAAFEQGVVDRYPTPNPRPVIVECDWPALVVVRDDHVLLEKSPTGEWWAGMLRFPKFPGGWTMEPVGTVSHTVTRHRVTFQVYVIHDVVADAFPDASWYPVRDLSALPIPSAMRKVWNVASNARLSLDFE